MNVSRHSQRMEWGWVRGSGGVGPFFSPEATILLVNTKDWALWPDPIFSSMCKVLVLYFQHQFCQIWQWICESQTSSAGALILVLTKGSFGMRIMVGILSYKPSVKILSDLIFELQLVIPHGANVTLTTDCLLTPHLLSLLRSLSFCCCFLIS